MLKAELHSGRVCWDVDRVIKIAYLGSAWATEEQGLAAEVEAVCGNYF